MAPYGRSFRGAGHVCERLAQGRYSESLLGSAKFSALTTTLQSHTENRL